MVFRFIGKDIHGTPMADRTYFKPRVLQSNKKKKKHSHREILNPDYTDLRPSAGRKIKNEQNSVEESLNYTQK